MSSFAMSSPLHSQSSVSPLRRNAMSIRNTYYLAHTARGKLSHEAAQADHELRRLVGHANLLDSLMLELAEAEQEQESWFNNSVRGAQKSERAHIQWADAVVEEEEEEEEEEAYSSDSSESDEEEEEKTATGFATLARVQSRTQYPATQHIEEEENEYEDDGEEDYAQLSLQRTWSHSSAPSSPPELTLDSEEDSSEDEQMPPSPPTDSIPSFSSKQSKKEQPSFFNSPSLISAISVY